ncbi:MAG: DUF1080 domain-containing protein [Planctomycetaceae bacterium]|nr:DUF1080 domain-containing protein [Planctomycetaceae bacterium]
MRVHCNFGIGLWSVCVLVVGLSSARGDEPGTPADRAQPAQDISLFDGKTLLGWKKTEFGSEAGVNVVDGCLELELGSPLTGVTITPEAFRKVPKQNYELTLEAKRVIGGDFFVGLTFPVKKDSCSLIMGGWGGGLIGISSLDSFDASENETTTYHAFKNDQWYKVRVRVTDDRIRVWLDNEPVINVETTDKRISTRIEVSLCEPLGLCTFQTTAHLRNLKMRPLTKTELARQEN